MLQAEVTSIQQPYCQLIEVAFGDGDEGLVAVLKVRKESRSRSCFSAWNVREKNVEYVCVLVFCSQLRSRRVWLVLLLD
jgi:hypothetical protein